MSEVSVVELKEDKKVSVDDDEEEFEESVLANEAEEESEESVRVESLSEVSSSSSRFLFGGVRFFDIAGGGIILRKKEKNGCIAVTSIKKG